MDKCEICNKKAEPVPYLAHEGIVTKMETANKRLWISNIILIVLLVASLCYTMHLRSQFEAVEETYEIEQDTDGGGNNYSVIGGDFNGEAENQSQEEKVHP